MKKITFALILIFVATVKADIKEIRELQEIIPAIKQNTLVIFDLDNTVMEPVQTLGSDQWFSYLVKSVTDTGIDLVTAKNRAIPPWTRVQMATRMQPVEVSTPSFIRALQKSGAKVMALTARPESLAVVTVEQLRSIGVDFSLASPARGGGAIEGVEGSIYFNGIAFVGANGDKGQTLINFLKQAKSTAQNIIFADDKIKNVQSVEAALQLLPVSHTGFRYGFDDEKVAAFSPKIAKIEWWFFEKYGRLISDEEANQAARK